MSYEISFSCMCNAGKIRKKNQDNFLCNKKYLEYNNNGLATPLKGMINNDTHAVFGVFDGLGGEQMGEMAAYIAAKSFAQYTYTADRFSDFQNICELADEEIALYVKQHGLHHMGTTAAVLSFESDKISLCNIGDTKIFRYCDSKLKQCSKDHVYSFCMGSKPQLYQKLGMQEEDVLLEPYMTNMSYNHGDIYLIASDGLTDFFTTQELENIISDTNYDDIGDYLMKKVLETSGRDNITFILLKIA